MKEGLESLGRLRLTGVALIVAAFIVGGLAGAAVERVRASGARRPPAFERFRPRPGMLPPYLERLDLTDDQRSEIREILERARPRTDTLLEETMPRIQAIMDSTHQAIRGVLTETQRERLDEAFPRGGLPWRRFRDRRPGLLPGGPPGGDSPPGGRRGRR